MDHAHQPRSERPRFRFATHEKVLIALGVVLSVGGMVGSTPGLGALAPGLLCIVSALLSVGVRYARFRRRAAQSGSTKRNTRSSSPGRKSSPGGSG
ncbi:MAG TPA: hypothetical protein VMT18_02110 [Planctomycetota bacterium]|nr:hypothetical protein [Planctomycetota bacterium]